MTADLEIKLFLFGPNCQEGDPGVEGLEWLQLQLLAVLSTWPEAHAPT